MGKDLVYRLFEDINLKDPFFDSLKADYSGFESWFLKKKDHFAYVHFNENESIDGFLYYKIENDTVKDVNPEIKGNIILKIGTFKTNPHGTRLGERFIKLALDAARANHATKCYVTLFEKQTMLMNLFCTYGFKKYGLKQSVDGEEIVLVKDLKIFFDDLFWDYPLVNYKGNKYCIGIYPEYHTVMFPDSILKNEKEEILKDISFTNSIYKVYICRMHQAKVLKKGDILVVYRTNDGKGYAEYRAVATSICTVINVKEQDDFNNFEEFYQYASKYSVFNRNDLLARYNKGKCILIKMVYNLAFPKRITRKALIEKAGIPRENYWGFMKLNNKQFDKILELSEVDESAIINKA